METKIEWESIGNHAQIRLTKKQEQVVGIEIYVTESQRRKILDTFPDKVISWKEAAPHYILLNQLASYQRSKLTQTQRTLTPEKENDLQELVALIKNICHTTAPLYEWIHSSEINFSDSMESLKKIKMEIKAYQAQVNPFLKASAEQNPSINAFYSYHEAKCEAFIAQLNEFEKNGISKAQLRQLVSNQNQVGLTSLGDFLRAQATHLASDGIAATDDITAARFDQLFSATAHPLRKALVVAKSDLEKQRTTHAARYLNSQSKIPTGQLKVLKYPNQAQERKIDTQHDEPKKSLHLPLKMINANKESSRWMNLMPYIKTKTFLGEGLDGSEGLDDADQLLTIYTHLCNAPNTPLPQLKKPSWLPYRLLTGEAYGARGMAAVIVLGLPVGVLLLGGGILVTATAIAVDFGLFLIQVALLLLVSPLILLAAAGDLIVQIPSFFSQNFETKFSFLVSLANASSLNVTYNALNQRFRSFSLVRQLKQWLLEQYGYYEASRADENKSERAALLNRIRDHQSEGFFNLVASRFFNFSSIAKFLHQKIKQLTYAARELRKVATLSLDTLQSLFDKDANPSQTEQKSVIDALKGKIEERNKFLIKGFEDALKGKIKDNRSPSEDKKTQINPRKYSPLKWHDVSPWQAKHYETPFDPLSDIGLGIVYELVNPAFEHNPGVATPTFVVSLICWGAFLFPTLGTLIPASIVNGLGYVPQVLAKGFMGKSLEAGLSDFAIKMISTFLQWKLTYFSIEAASAVYHGDLEWIKKIFENPEEITLGAATFISMGYGVVLIPELPTDISILHQSSHPFLNGFTGYTNAIYGGFATALNAISEEAREVSQEAAFGLNTLELAFIGLKGSLLIYGLISGIAENTIKPLSLDTKQLVADFKAIDKLERENLIAHLLSQYGIADLNSNLAKQITDLFSKEIELEEIRLKHQGTQTYRLDSPQSESESEAETKTEATNISPSDNFKIARDELTELLQLICEMEMLGISIDLDPENSIVVPKWMNEPSTANIAPLSDPEESESGSPRTETPHTPPPPTVLENQPIGYQSKVNAELFYNALFFAIEKHNQEARKLGLFCEQIDGSELLHNFYNKHCYTGSSGWHKILFGILLFPLTWAWRGIKYLVGTPAVRHQVKKSFSKDFAMLFQLITDVIAPMLRSFLKAVMYATRMALGILVLLPLTLAITVNLLVFLAGLVCTIPWAIHLSVQPNHEPDAQKFAQNVQNCFGTFKTTIDTVWNTLLHNDLVNDYIAIVAKVGSPSGTGSPHRIDFLKLTGISAWYAKLTACADTRSDHLQASAWSLREQLQKHTADSLLERMNLERAKKTSMLKKLVNYDIESKNRWLPRSSAREGQLERLSYQALFQKERLDTTVLEKAEQLPKETLTTTVNSIIARLESTSRLRQYLSQN